MLNYNTDCYALKCEYNDRYYRKCNVRKSHRINSDGVCNLFKPYNYTGEFKHESLKSALSKNQIPVITKCVKYGYAQMIYVNACINCHMLESWSLDDTEIVISCKSLERDIK